MQWTFLDCMGCKARFHIMHPVGQKPGELTCMGCVDARRPPEPEKPAKLQEMREMQEIRELYTEYGGSD